MWTGESAKRQRYQINNPEDFAYVTSIDYVLIVIVFYFCLFKGRVQQFCPFLFLSAYCPRLTPFTPSLLKKSVKINFSLHFISFFRWKIPFRCLLCATHYCIFLFGFRRKIFSLRQKMGNKSLHNCLTHPLITRNVAVFIVAEINNIFNYLN